MATVRVTAYGRVKPCSPQAMSQDISLQIGPKESRVIFTDHNLKPESYRFKKIFDENSTQVEIFDVVARPLIENTLKGYNSTILSYGQTGTGKTYTMTGEFHHPEYYGLIPRSIEEIFKKKVISTEITISYFEIYNEHVYDLIKSDEQSKFEISERGPLSNNSGLAFRSLSRYKINTIDQAMNLLLKGDSKKMIAQTCSNERSSRSHTIFAVGLKFPHPNGGETYMNPVLLLVDLAGSENLSKYKGNHNFFETRYINLSLHYLEQVLLALRRPKRIHVPYRNSIMTTFLKNSLGGSCITAVIATFSLAAINIQETRQTCRFAVNVACIKNELRVNEEIQYSKKLEDLEKEVEILRAQLNLLTKEESGVMLTEEDKEACIKEVQKFISEGLSIYLPLKDLKKVKFCFHVLRRKILKMNNSVNLIESKHKSDYLSDDDYMKDLGKVNSRTRTVLNSTELTVEKNWRNQKQPIELPKVNITYENFSKTEEITEKENLPLENRVTDSETKLLEARNENKPPPRVVVKVKDCTTTCEINFSETSLQQRGKTGKKQCPSTSCFEVDDDPSELSVLAEVSNEFITNTTVQNISIEKVYTKEAVCESDSEVTDEEGEAADSDDQQPGENNQSPVDGLPLTGDDDVDEEIIKFYKNRFEHFREK